MKNKNWCKLVLVVLVSLSILCLFIHIQSSWVPGGSKLNDNRLGNIKELNSDQAEQDEPSKPYLKISDPSGSRLVPKYGNYSSQCLEIDHKLQDLFCVHKLPFLDNVKNPCWYEGTSDKTIKLRCLPYYHILGCAKCATTDLYARLTSHPHILNNQAFLNKEAQWWAWKRYGFNNFVVMKAKSLEKYTEVFDNTAEYITQLISDNSSLVHKVITGDGSPPDFWDFRGWNLIAQNKDLTEPKILTPHLMQYIYRNPKFILLLRNPTERLYSDFYFLEQGNNAYSFHEVVVSSMSTILNCLANHNAPYCFFSAKIFSKLKCRIHYGCYVIFLQEWFKVFGREDFYIVRTEDYSENIEKHLSEIYDFLGVYPLNSQMLDTIEERKRKRVRKKQKSSMLTKTRKILDEFYQDYNIRLAEFLHDKKYLWSESSYFSLKREGDLDKFKSLFVRGFT